MNIFVFGQCTLHWGRMEFGNVGNYYIIEPFFRELRRVFPQARIKTTLQMSERFSIDEGVSVLPMDSYYGWTGNDLHVAREEVRLAEDFCERGCFSGDATPFMVTVLWADLIIDFSGDIWGDNADFLGEDRFEVGLLKDRTAQLLGKRTVMLAGSPGPFRNEKLHRLARDVYQSFDLVTNREPLSTELLEGQGFDCSNTLTLGCPAFLFQGASSSRIPEVIEILGGTRNNRSAPVVGFIVCGWNFGNGPYDKWPRADAEYETFAAAVELVSEKLGATVCLLSHSNGFDIPPEPFVLRHGRDYPVAKQLQEVVRKRGIANNVIALDGIYDAWQTKAIIGQLDMLISGRVHAAVAALSQNIPTVILDYGHEPKAHKLRGFAAIAGASKYVADPSSKVTLESKIRECWAGRDEYQKHLAAHIPVVRKEARAHFDLLKALV